MNREARQGADYLILSACAVIFLAMLFPLRGAITDDTYIHMQYARNIVETGELSFNRGDPSYGATSPLWVFLLSIARRLGGDLETWSLILSRFFGFACILLVYRFTFAVGGRRTAACAAALIMAADAWLLRWSAVGMETSFAVFMVTLTLFASLDAARSIGRSALFGLLLFLSFLARPEALLLVPLAIFAFSAAGRKKSVLCRFTWIVVAAVLFTVWFPLIRAHTGTFFPLTAGAKQGSIVFSAALLRRAKVPAMILGATSGLLLVLLVTGSVYAASRGRKALVDFTGDRASGLMLSFLWIWALPAVYVLMDFQILSRYMLPVTPALIVLSVSGLSFFVTRRRNTLITVLAGIVIAQNVFFYHTVVVGPTREFSHGLRTVMVEMGKWLSVNSAPQSVVAAPDIGAIGYYSGRRVLDLGGLVSPEINRMRANIDVERIIDEGLFLEFGADYLLDRSSDPMRFDGRVIKGRLYTALISGVVENLGIRKQEPVTYVLYRLEKTVSEKGAP